MDVQFERPIFLRGENPALRRLLSLRGYGQVLSVTNTAVRDSNRDSWLVAVQHSSNSPEGSVEEATTGDAESESKEDGFVPSSGA